MLNIARKRLGQELRTVLVDDTIRYEPWCKTRDTSKWKRPRRCVLLPFLWPPHDCSRTSVLRNSFKRPRAGKRTLQRAFLWTKGTWTLPFPGWPLGQPRPPLPTGISPKVRFSKPVGKKSGSRRSGSFLTFFRSSFPKIPVTEPISDPVTLANLIFLLSGGNSDSFYCIYLSQIYCTQMDDSGLCFLLRSIFILSHQEERYAGPEGCSAQPSDTSYFSLLKKTAVVTEVLS